MGGEEPRVGVYICHCGGNISNYVDVKKVVEAVKNYPGVVVAKDYVFMCSDTGQSLIIKDIKENKLNGIVVAACSPKLHETTFRRAVERGGLNPYVFYHVNIREHCSWAHTHDIEEATRKAISHVIAGIEYVKLARKLERISVSVEKNVLVIGGGVAGLTAAKDLVALGFNVVILEKEPFLGGNVARWGEVAPTGKLGRKIVEDLVNSIRKNRRVTIITNGEIADISGYLGNFEVKVKIKPRYVIYKHSRIREAINACPIEVPNEYDFGLTKRKAIYYPYEGAYPEIPVIDMKSCTRCGKCIEILQDAVDLDQKEEYVSFKVGAILVATGFKPYEPKRGEFGYGEYPDVITLPQLERILDKMGGNGNLVLNGKKIESIAFIYCVGSRGTNGVKNKYCSRYCCTVTNYTALRIKRMFKNVRIYHLYRDIRTYGFYEEYYLDSQGEGMIYIKYDESSPPEVLKDGEILKIRVKDYIANKTVEFPVDLVVLVVGMEPNQDEELRRKLKISIGEDGFYKEAHMKLRPVDTLRAGVFIAGASQAPRLISEAKDSAKAAVAKIAALLKHEKIELEPKVVQVDPSRCTLSRKCMEVCPVGAIVEKNYGDMGIKAWVNEALCLGCGACTAICPEEAIQLKTLTTEQIKNMIIASAAVWGEE